MKGYPKFAPWTCESWNLVKSAVFCFSRKQPNLPPRIAARTIKTVLKVNTCRFWIKFYTKIDDVLIIDQPILIEWVLVGRKWFSLNRLSLDLPSPVQRRRHPILKQCFHTKNYKGNRITPFFCTNMEYRNNQSTKIESKNSTSTQGY